MELVHGVKDAYRVNGGMTVKVGMKEKTAGRKVHGT